jgi:hypothetical protein
MALFLESWVMPELRSTSGVLATGILTLIVFIQLILGGAVLLSPTFPNWVPASLVEAHIGLGHGIWIIAIAPAVILWRVKPPSTSLKIGGLALLALTIVQANVFGVLGPWKSQIIMAAHGITAGLIFAMAVALVVLATKR